MTRETIVTTLRKHIEDGRLLSKPMTGKCHATIDRGIAKGEYLETYFESILAKDLEAKEWFNEMVCNKGIMNALQARVDFGFKTDYELNKACMCGVLVKFPDFGKACPLYIK